MYSRIVSKAGGGDDVKKIYNLNIYQSWTGGESCRGRTAGMYEMRIM